MSTASSTVLRRATSARCPNSLEQCSPTLHCGEPGQTHPWHRRAVVRNGVRILSPVRATAFGRRSVTTDRGTISTKYIVQATEGYTSDIDGQHRNMVPLYSMMIATEPLPEDMWNTIGLANRPTFDDSATSSSTGNELPTAGSHSAEEEPRTISGRLFARHSIPTPP